MYRSSWIRLALLSLVIFCLADVGLVSPFQEGGAQGRPDTGGEVPGFLLGKVFEVDKDKYEEYLRRTQGGTLVLDEGLQFEDFLIEREDVVVNARRLESDIAFDSEPTNDDGDYSIPDTPAGVYEFTLGVGDDAYPVSQRLNVNVELGYIAELCFVIDRSGKNAWMVAEGFRRTADVPPFVPFRCRSQLGSCLAGLVGEGRLPNGLLLLLAGSASGANSLGVQATQETEASDPRP